MRLLSVLVVRGHMQDSLSGFQASRVFDSKTVNVISKEQFERIAPSMSKPGDQPLVSPLLPPRQTG